MSVSTEDGLIAEYRCFRDLSELPNAGLALAVVELNFFLDHYVTVCEVMDDQVVVGDPSVGRVLLSRQEFVALWCFVGVVLRRP